MKLFLILMTFLLFAKVSATQQPWKARCFDGIELLFFKNKKNFNDAYSACRKSGSHLAKIDSQKITDAINAAFKVYGNENTFYIGGRDIAWEGDWKWQDGTDVIMRGEAGYQNWKYDEPNGGISEDCLVVGRGTYKWEDISCSDEYYYICQKGPFVEIQQTSSNEKKCVTTKCTHAARVAWFKESIKVTTQPTNSTYQTLESGAATLNVQNSSIADAGAYSCSVWIDNSWKGGAAFTLYVSGDPIIHEISNSTCTSDVVITWQPSQNAVGFPHKIKATSFSTYKDSIVWVDSPTSGIQTTTIPNLTPSTKYSFKIFYCVTKTKCAGDTTNTAMTGGFVLSARSSSMRQHQETETCVISWSISDRVDTNIFHNVEVNLTSTLVSSRGSNIPSNHEVKNITSFQYSFQPEPNRKYSATIKIFNCAGSSEPTTATGSCSGKPQTPCIVFPPKFVKDDYINTCGRIDMMIKAPDESNGLVSCLLVIVSENLDTIDDKFNLTRLNNSANGNYYIAIAIPILSMKGKQINITLGDESTSSCDVYDTGAAISQKHKNVIFGQNKRLSSEHSYSVFVVSSTPSSDHIHFNQSSAVTLKRKGFEFNIISSLIGFAVCLFLALAIAVPIICKLQSRKNNYKKIIDTLTKKSEDNYATMKAIQLNTQSDFSPTSEDTEPLQPSSPSNRVAAMRPNYVNTQKDLSPEPENTEGEYLQPIPSPSNQRESDDSFYSDN